jgi:hypothetical protein
LTYARNLHAHNGNRNPWLNMGWRAALYNNLAYNAKGAAADPGAFGFFQIAAGYDVPWPLDVAWINNVAIAGPDGHPDGRTFKFGAMTPLESSLPNRVYLRGNQGPHISGPEGDAQWAGVTFWDAGFGGRNSQTTLRSNSIPSWLTAFNLSIMPPADVETYVTANAGARPLDRDSVDVRIVADVRRRTGAHVTADAFPTLAENYRPLTLPQNPHALADAVGRTRIEVWLESFARALEPRQQ